MQLRQPSSLATRCWLALLAALLGGCAQLDVPDKLPWPVGSSKPQTPRTITAIWSDTIMYRANQPAVRGFGGRIHFFGADEEQPIKVDGTLTVYAFDAADPAKVHPERKFVFLREQLDKHRSQSPLGDSYSFWLPWGPVDGPERKISLVARFESADGAVALSEPANVVLPGTSSRSNPAPAAPVPQPAPGAPIAATAAPPCPAVRQISHHVIQQTEVQLRPPPFTINLPSSFVQHMRPPAKETAAGQPLWQTATSHAPPATAPAASPGPAATITGPTAPQQPAAAAPPTD